MDLRKLAVGFDRGSRMTECRPGEFLIRLLDAMFRPGIPSGYDLQSLQMMAMLSRDYGAKVQPLWEDGPA